MFAQEIAGGQGTEKSADALSHIYLKSALASRQFTAVDGSRNCAPVGCPSAAIALDSTQPAPGHLGGT